MIVELRARRATVRWAARTCLVIGALLSCGCQTTKKAEPGEAASGAAPNAPPPPLDTSWHKTLSRPLSVGETAPDFEGIAHTGMRVKLSAFLGKPVAVFFYDADKSQGATAAVRSLRDNWLRLNDKLGMVLGVSVDDRISHRDFATLEELPFLLVADEKAEIVHAFGVPVEGGRAHAALFVVDPGGKVRVASTDTPPESVAQKILDSL